METFEQYTEISDFAMLEEDLKHLGKLKLAKSKDVLNSHRFKTRGTNRKNLRQVPDVHQTKVEAPVTSKGIGDFVNQPGLSNRAVDIAKKAKSGVWRISKAQVLDIARKYKFNVPNGEKPMKHLGSSGIMMIRYRPGVFYLYKSRKRTRKNRVGAKGGKMFNFKMGIGL